MGTKLARISEMSVEHPDMVFTSIGHLIDVKLLTECHRDMDGKKAVGIDGVTKDEYGKNRRSEKKSYTWDGFSDVLKRFSLVEPKIYVNVYS